MPWYKSGTVSVTQNSNAVIGAGTAFLSNGRVGDAFRGPDGAWYEVINIASDTAMSISPPYLGASIAAGAYAVAPMQGYVKESADALRALVNTYGQKLADLGTTGNYNILPVAKGGTGGATQAEAQAGLGLVPQNSALDKVAGRVLTVGAFGRNGTSGLTQPNTVDVNGLTVQARYSFPNGGINLPESTCHIEHNPHAVAGYASQWGEGLTTNNIYHRTQVAGVWSAWEVLVRGGANSSITSLSGLTTALSIAQGGTGNSTGTATRLAAAAILGSVAQSGGVPTGSIIERGSNSNGEYVKLADGTLIAFLNPAGNPSIAANAFAAFGPYGTPVNFSSNIFFVSAVVVPNSSNDTYGVLTSYSLSNNTVGFVFRNGASAQTFGNIKILCVGRWF